jgi:hypothetical protein
MGPTCSNLEPKHEVTNSGLLWLGWNPVIEGYPERVETRI